jgi:hypothetical protein
MGLSMDAVDLPRIRRKVTQPLSGTVAVMIRLVLLGLILPVLIALLDNGRIVLYGFGLSNVCATVSVNGLMESGGQPLAHLRRGVFSSPSTVDLCASHPTFGQRLLVTLTQAPADLLWLVLLVLLLLLIRTVRRSGPFDRGVIRRLRFLAWFTLAASLAASTVQAFAAAEFTASAGANQVPGGWGDMGVPVMQDTINGALGINWIPLLLVVCGLLTLARIIRIGAQMHDDLAGTI